MTSMHKKPEIKDIVLAPGVGTYDLLHLPNLNHQRTNKYSFGKGTRDRSPTELEQKHKPGVGSYKLDSHTDRRSPRATFGSAKRPGIVHRDQENSPAPGHYKVPTKMANVANYHSAIHEDKYKHV